MSVVYLPSLPCGLIAHVFLVVLVCPNVVERVTGLRSGSFCLLPRNRHPVLALSTMSLSFVHYLPLRVPIQFNCLVCCMEVLLCPKSH